MPRSRCRRGPRGATASSRPTRTSCACRSEPTGSAAAFRPAMTPNDAIDIGRDAIVVSLKLGGPIMLLALVVGVVISLFQALTQIQESTLTFVPKIVAILLAMLLLMPFMLTTLTTFTERLFDRVVSG